MPMTLVDEEAVGVGTGIVWRLRFGEGHAVGVDVPTRLTAGGVGEGALVRRGWSILPRCSNSSRTARATGVAVQATLA
jgi:hypothetical protein